MKKAKIYLLAISITGITGGTIACMFGGTTFFTTNIYGRVATWIMVGTTSTRVFTGASYYYYTFTSSTPAYYYSILRTVQ